jgi:flavin-dependent dehydrogenase
MLSALYAFPFSMMLALLCRSDSLLKSGEVRYKVPPNRRIRVRWEGLRRLILEGSHVRWGKKVNGIDRGKDGALVVKFEDGEAVEADLAIGCDGISSKAREFVVGKRESSNWSLPVGLTGVSVEMSRENAEKMRKLDPLFLQAAEEGKDVFFWFSCKCSALNLQD